jgi:argininosuccinate lyase
MAKNKKLWSGRFKKPQAKLLDEFNSSLNIDKRLYSEDIDCSLAHVSALTSAKIISKKEASKITNGLKRIKSQINSKGEKWFLENKGEDIHTVVENKLTNLVGETGKKLHTGRSRNDQVITDVRLWLKKELKEIIVLAEKLRNTFINAAKKHYKTIMPGYTHLQQAQPVTFGHYLLAYEQKLSRDLERLNECLKRTDTLVLGSGALAGSGFSINRNFLAKKLGFKKISENSIDAVSDRDFIAEGLFSMALLNIHLSQWAEEMILWNTKEFSFIEIPDSYATGSSIMPQKKNPDIPELIRGKTGRFIGNLTAMLNILKGLPLAYNKDLQEDKELIFDSVDNIKIVLKISNEFLQNVVFNKDRMLTSVLNSFTNATEVADYLTKKGVPFRTAHGITGKVVLYCIKNKKLLKDLTPNDWKKFHNLFGSDIIEKIKVNGCLSTKKIYGGTAPEQVLKAVNQAKKKRF